MTAEPYTTIPNWLIEAMPQMPGSVFQIAVVIARQTIGYSDGNGGRKEWDRISLSQFEKATGLSNLGVRMAITQGLGKWFTRREKGQSFEYQLCNLVTQCNSVTMQLSNIELGNSVTRLDPELCNSVTPQKKKRKKRKKEEREAAPPPVPAKAHVLQLDAKGRLRHTDSPYLDPKRFDANGFIPPGTGRNAVEVFYERRSVFEVRLTGPNEDDLARHCPDLDRLRDIVATCDRRDYKPGNIDVILDLYRKGTQHATTRQNGAGYVTPSPAPPSYDNDIQFDADDLRRRLKIARGYPSAADGGRSANAPAETTAGDT